MIPLFYTRRLHDRCHGQRTGYLLSADKVPDTDRVLGSGCELGIASSVDNIRAMVSAAEDFAREG